ncbi:WD40 repeat-like protein [Sodiomyces alkalinus F11]|uniref:WD40 repeat-like protein n=1 Tax=Sodiomyces alkalinus (strain CBS 110278 / VKM F-3762 / F11) TaxID=1314773 RepID=A0A3N2PXD7_SODAK|nr:WD40 repeat-like protein [Sodiomyces alkalinus F11]ROT39134.1 WD40 repeat-like protein [Sodiomyces alkalinus F11]
MSFPDEPVAHLLGSNGPIHSLAYSASPGTYILTGSSDRTIRLYNPFPSKPETVYPTPSTSHITAKSSSSFPVIPQGRLIQSYSAHGYEVLSLDVAADNERFVSAGGDRAVFLWDVSTATTTRRFGSTAHGHTARVNCVRFAGDSDSLVLSGGVDTTVRIWDAKSGNAKPVQVLDEARDAVTCLAVRGAEVLAGSVDGRVRAYDVRMGRCVADVVGASVTSLSLARDGRAVLVGSLDSRLRLMDREHGTCLRTYSDPAWRNEEFRVQAVLGGREKWVVAGDEMTAAGATTGPGPGPGTGTGTANVSDGKVWAWDLLTGELAAVVRVPWGPPGSEPKKKVLGKDGKEKDRTNVTSCIAWKEDGWGDQFCVGGTSGVVTVFGTSA